MIPNTQMGRRAGVGLSGLILLAALAGSAASAQTETSTEKPASQAVSDTSKTEPDAEARQLAVKSLRKMGVNLDWHKATLTELKQTQADLIAAGEDEDLRLRVILAARLREQGLRLNWRHYTSDQLLDKYNAAQDTASRDTVAKQETATSTDESVANEETPAPAPRRQRQRQVSQVSNGYAGDQGSTYNNAYVVQPVVVQQVPVVSYGYGYGAYCPPGYQYCPPGTYYTSDGLTITTGRTYYRRNDCPPNVNVGYCPPTQNIRYQPGAKLPAPISMPGAKPGTPGAIPILKPPYDPNVDRH